MATSTIQSSRYELPGFTLPLNYEPGDHFDWGFQTKLFNNALGRKDCGYGPLKTLREITMMQVMNAITDKPEWDRKVFDEAITSKWTEEIFSSGQDVTPKMMEWDIEELKYKAKIYQETGITSVYDADVVKSDTAIPKELRDALEQAMHPLEDVPEDQKDYHPGSDKKVVDLVHPSLFPVIYGRSRILENEVTGLNGCLARSGNGKILPVPTEEEAKLPGSDRYDPWGGSQYPPFSRKFQWLPCDVAFKDADECRITSYVNNLHPKHKDLYEVLEKIIARTVPLWDRTLTPLRRWGKDRIKFKRVEYLPRSTPEPQREDGEDSDDEAFWQRRWEWESSHPVKQPEPGVFLPPQSWKDSRVSLREHFKAQGMQVIVKLANIELTPEKPEYEGGSWHIEGQLNEHICATAIYYFSNENITSSSLSFRQRVSDAAVMDIRYQQGHEKWLTDVFGCENDGPLTQDLGSVSCIEGRLLTFPNVLQHRVAPFSLADRTKPGHRKILALFLVDPNIRIISTANVPPQRADWWEDRLNLRRDVLEKKLPPELQDMVMENLDDFPIPMDEAKQYRLELMQERGAASEMQNQKFQEGSFSLCEH